MSPRSVDPMARTKQRRSAAPAAPRTPAPLDRVDARLDLDINGPPDQILPAILDPFAQGAVPAVMTRIALDWIIEEPVLNQLFEQAAEDQYTREWALAHLVGVMVDVACGFRPSPRAAFLRRQLERIASLSSFYRKLDRMELAIPAAVVRHTAGRARDLIVAAGALMAEPIPG
jgi:hypothetical protein